MMDESIVVISKFFAMSFTILIVACRLLLHFFKKSYFASRNFKIIKSILRNNIQECNELNAYIENLKLSFFNIGRTDYGRAVYSALKMLADCKRVYNCSADICKRACDQPFKYFCKYFNVPADEETLNDFERVFNDFSSVELGRKLLLAERDYLVTSIKCQIPVFIYKFRKQKLLRELGFDQVIVDDMYFPKYTFRYISPAGNSSLTCDIIFDIANLERFIKYLAGLVTCRGSVVGKRVVMTTMLRNNIMQRDNYTCQCCRRSGPYLLLEIDYIKPLSDGGFTTENNLQTLCWKCRRKK